MGRRGGGGAARAARGNKTVTREDDTQLGIRRHETNRDDRTGTDADRDDRAGDTARDD